MAFNIPIPVREEFPDSPEGVAEFQKSLLEFSVAAVAAGENGAAIGALRTLNPVRYRDLGKADPPPPAAVTVYRQPGTVAGTFDRAPAGIILHGSRSGQHWSVRQEFDSCRGYAEGGANGLGWNASLGEDAYSVHIRAAQWGWNARRASDDYLAVEFAQANLGDPIGDAQVRAFAAWYRAEVVPVWGALDLGDDRALPTHAEVEHRGETGQIDGKTDTHAYGDPGADDLRRRIRAAL